MTAAKFKREINPTLLHSQFRGGEGVNAGVGEVEWVVQKDRYKYDEMFDKLGPIDGKIGGAAAKQEWKIT